VEILPGKKTEESMNTKCWEDAVDSYRSNCIDYENGTWKDAISEEDFNELGEEMEKAWTDRANLFYGFRKAGLTSRLLYLVFPHWFCDDLYRRIK